MTALPQLLATIPGVYDDLLDASLPGHTGEVSDHSPDPRAKPAPGRLDVIEHRHALVNGLRWWVDAVRERGEHTEVGHDVRRMARWLLDHLAVMDDGDRGSLRSQLDGWLDDAYPFMGSAETKAVDLPAGAEEQLVKLADASRLLGMPVSTIKSRVQAGSLEVRATGPIRVRLGDVMARCGHCDLLVGQCPHTRTVTVLVAQ